MYIELTQNKTYKCEILSNKKNIMIRLKNILV